MWNIHYAAILKSEMLEFSEKEDRFVERMRGSWWDKILVVTAAFKVLEFHFMICYSHWAVKLYGQDNISINLGVLDIGFKLAQNKSPELLHDKELDHSVPLIMDRTENRFLLTL